MCGLQQLLPRFFLLEVVLLPLLHAAPPTQVCRGAVGGIVPAGGEVQALPRILLLLRCHLLVALGPGFVRTGKGGKILGNPELPSVRPSAQRALGF